MQPDEMDEATLRRLLATDMPEPPVWLAARIAANATSQPQKLGLLGFLDRAFSEWNYGLQFKGAALAAFAVLGLLSAQMAGGPNPYALDIGTVLMAEPNWTEEL